jgi:hypothetical protein
VNLRTGQPAAEQLDPDVFVSVKRSIMLPAAALGVRGAERRSWPLRQRGSAANAPRPPPGLSFALPPAVAAEYTTRTAAAVTATPAARAKPAPQLPRAGLADQEVELVLRRRRDDAQSCAAACPKDPTSGVTAMVVDGGSPGQ